MKNRILIVKLMVSVLAGAALLFLFIRRILHHIFTNIAIGRKTVDLLKYNQSKRFIPPMGDVEEERKWMKEQQMEEITIQSKDGFQLTGHYLPAENAKRTLLLFHGWRSGWIHDFAVMAEQLHRHGCNLLFIEQRAHGKSEGNYIGFGVLERFDCMEWIHYQIHCRKESLPIYLTGISMGASTVLMAAGLELPEEVKGVIADCGFTSPYEMVFRVARQVLPVNRHTLSGMDHICRKRAGYSLAEYDTLHAMEVCRTPVLFVHGTADSLVPVDMTLQNYKACKAKKELLLVEGAEHCRSFAKDREEYLRTISRFFGWEQETA